MLAVESLHHDTLVILDDPEPDHAEDLVRDTLGRERLKLIMTLPTPEPARAPNFGHDLRVRTLSIDPLSDARGEELLRAAGARLDYSLGAWIIDQAGGIPGVLLLAASVGSELRRSVASFGDNVAEAFLRKIRVVFGDETARILRLLSLLTYVGVEGTARAELDSTCRLIGGGITPNDVLNAVPGLLQTGVVRQAGAYVEVVPPLLANHLAAAAIRGRAIDLVALFGALPQGGRARLLRRLRGVEGEAAEEFWVQLVGPEGLFRDLASIVANGYLFRQIASAVPERAAELMDQGLQDLDLDRRLMRGANWCGVLKNCSSDSKRPRPRCEVCCCSARRRRNATATTQAVCSARSFIRCIHKCRCRSKIAWKP